MNRHSQIRNLQRFTIAAAFIFTFFLVSMGFVVNLDVLRADNSTFFMEDNSSNDSSSIISDIIIVNVSDYHSSTSYSPLPDASLLLSKTKYHASENVTIVVLSNLTAGEGLLKLYTPVGLLDWFSMVDFSQNKVSDNSSNESSHKFNYTFIYSQESQILLGNYSVQLLIDNVLVSNVTFEKVFDEALIETPPVNITVFIMTDKELYNVSEPVQISITVDSGVDAALDLMLTMPDNSSSLLEQLNMSEGLTTFNYTYMRESQILLGSYQLAIVSSGISLAHAAFTVTAPELLAPSRVYLLPGFIDDYHFKDIPVSVMVKTLAGEKELAPEEQLEPGTYDLSLFFNQSIIRSIEVKDADLDGSASALFEIDTELNAEDYPDRGFVRVYAINPKINYTYADVTVTAVSDALFKCAAWNFRDRICEGEWVEIQRLIPGQNYTLRLTPDDPAVAEGSYSVIRAVQRGSVNLAGTSATVNLISSVNTSSSMLIFSYTGTGVRPDNLLLEGHLLNATAIRFTRASSSEAATIAIQWYLAEFSHGVFVQNGTATHSAITTNVALPTAVIINKTFPITSFRNDASGAWGTDDEMRTRLTSTTNLEAVANQATGSLFAWQAVQYDGARVQNGTFLMTTTSNNVDITQVNLNKSFVIANWHVSAGVTARDTGVMANFTNSTRIHFERSNDNGANLGISWYVVEFTGRERVQQGTFHFGSSSTDADINLSTAFNVSSSIAFLSGNQKGGKGTETTQAVGTLWFTANLTNATTLHLHRALTSSDTADVGWFVVEFAAFPNFAPINPAVTLTSANGTNTTYEELYCNATLYDDDADLMNVTVRWYNNSVLWLTENYNNDYTNGTDFSASLGSGNTSVGETWTCSLQLTDWHENSGWMNSSDVTILDSDAPIVTLNSPGAYYSNYSLATVSFNCSATDNYLLKNISLYITDAQNTSFSRYATTDIGGTSNSSNWTLSLGNGNYTWNCLAYDNASLSGWGESNHSLSITPHPSTLWWNASWLYRQAINVSVASGVTPRNYQVLIMLNTFNNGTNWDWNNECVTNNMTRSRFVNESNNGLLDFWVESCNATTKNMSIWVEIDKNLTTTPTTIYLYYGNTEATPESDGNATFEFFDHFHGTALDSRWQVDSTSYAVSSSSLRINTGAVALVSALPFRFNDGYILESRVFYHNLQAAYGGTLSVQSSQYTAGSNGGSAATSLYMRQTNSRVLNRWTGSGSAASYNCGNAATWTSSDGVWYIVGQNVNATSTKLTRGRTLAYTVSCTWTKNINYFSLGYFAGGAASAVQDTSYDWILVRKYANPEPLAVIYAQENAPDDYPSWSSSSSSIPLVYSPTVLSFFNITWEDDKALSHVWFESNYSGAPTNYSMNNITALIYNHSAVLPAGSYYWKSFANDTHNQWNYTSTWAFSIARATTLLTLVANTTLVVPLGTSTNMTCYSDNLQSNYSLYRNGTLVNSSVGGMISDLQTLPAGTYIYICNATLSQNYSAASTSKSLIVTTKIIPNCSLTFQNPSPIVFGTGTNASCSCNNPEASASLWRNDTNVTSEINVSVILAAGTYAYVCNVSETTNYAYGYNITSYNISKAAGALVLYVNGSTEDYVRNVSFDVNITCLLSTPTPGNLTLYENGAYLNNSFGSLVSHFKGYSAVSNNNITCLLDHQNYTASDMSWINATDTIAPLVSLLAPSSGSTISMTPLVQFNVSVTDNGDLNNCTLWTDISGSWEANETLFASGQQASLTWNLSYIPNGAYSWNAYCCDSADTCAFGATNFTFIMSRPAITINSPSGVLADHTPTLNVTVYETVDTLWYSLDSGMTNVTICRSCSGTQYTFLVREEGSYTLSVYANDSFNNRGSASTSFSVDMNSNHYDTFNDNSSVDILNFLSVGGGNVSLLPPASVIGDGTDGSLTVTAANTYVNNYTYLTANENAGDTVIAVNSGSAFANGDQILIIQMQNGSGTGSSGNYEFRTITSGGGTGSLTLDTGLSNTYGSGTFNADPSTVTQIVRVPQYTTLWVSSSGSITAPAWDGYTGGIVIFRAYDVYVNGSINATQKGFRGGLHGTPSACANGEGEQGESYQGKGACGFYAGNANGDDPNEGGGGIDVTGGGGGYGTAGENSDSWNGGAAVVGQGGVAYGSADLSRIYFGSGGAGSYQGGSGSGDGGDGGGIILVYTNSLNVSGTVESAGQKGQGYGSGSFNYGSGGGAGGTIWITAGTIRGRTAFANATNGTGYVPPATTRNGGDGGLGRIRLDFNDLVGGTTTPVYYAGNASGISLTGNYTIHAINTTNNITSILNITWNEWNTDAGNNITVQLSTNGGGVWYNVTNGSNLSSPVSGRSLLYRAFFTTIETHLISLLDMNITWTDQDFLSPAVTLNVPSDGYWHNISTALTFNCSATDNALLKNISLYITNSNNQSFSWYATTNISGTSNSSTWSLQLENGNYTWNCLAYDNSSNYDWGDTNYSLYVNYSQSSLPANVSVRKSIRNNNSVSYNISLNISNRDGTNISVLSVYDYVPSGFNASGFTLAPNHTNMSTGRYSGGYVLTWIFTNVSGYANLTVNYSVNVTNAFADAGELAMVGIDPLAQEGSTEAEAEEHSIDSGMKAEGGMLLQEYILIITFIVSTALLIWYAVLSRKLRKKKDS